MQDARTLRLARQAIVRGNRAEGRQLLIEFLRAHPEHEIAWLWLSTVVDSPTRERECLERVLQINPDNVIAWNHCVKLDQAATLRGKVRGPPLIRCPFCAMPVRSSAEACERCGRNMRTGELPRPIGPTVARQSIPGFGLGRFLLRLSALGLILSALLSWLAGPRVSLGPLAISGRPDYGVFLASIGLILLLISTFLEP